MIHFKKPATLLAALTAAAFTSLVSAQAQQASSADKTSDSGESASDLAKKLQNPIGDLYSIPFQGNTNFGVGPHRGT